MMMTDDLGATFGTCGPDATCDPHALAEGRRRSRTWPPFEMSLPAVTKHLKVLETRGFDRAVAGRNGAHAACMRPRSRAHRIGSSNIGGSGTRASIDWMST